MYERFNHKMISLLLKLFVFKSTSFYTVGSVFLEIIMTTIILVFVLCPSNISKEYGNAKRLRKTMCFGFI